MKKLPKNLHHLNLNLSYNNLGGNIEGIKILVEGIK